MKQPGATAICIMRLERRGAGLLITVRMNADIRQLSGEWERSYADVDQALDQVRDFIQGYQIQSAIRAADRSAPGGSEIDPAP